MRARALEARSGAWAGACMRREASGGGASWRRRGGSVLAQACGRRCERGMDQNETVLELWIERTMTCGRGWAGFSRYRAGFSRWAGFSRSKVRL
jgi:hypothetical protein